MSDLSPQNELLDWVDVYPFKGNRWSDWQKFVDRKCYTEAEKIGEGSLTSCAEFETDDYDIYGDQPEFGEFELVVCDLCSNKYKPAALRSHIRNRHENKKRFFDADVKLETVLRPAVDDKEIENRSASDKVNKLQFAKHDEPLMPIVDKFAIGMAKRQLDETKTKEPSAKKAKSQPITGFFRPTKSETALPNETKTETKNSKSFPKSEGVRPSVTVSISNATILSQLQINGPAKPPIEEPQIVQQSVLKRIKVLCPKRNPELLAKENTHLLALKGILRIKEASAPYATACTQEVSQLHPGYRRCKGLLTTTIYSP